MADRGIASQKATAPSRENRTLESGLGLVSLPSNVGFVWQIGNLLSQLLGLLRMGFIEWFPGNILQLGAGMHKNING